MTDAEIIAQLRSFHELKGWPVLRLAAERLEKLTGEPTEAMVEAAEAHWLRGSTNGWSRDNPRGIWAAMKDAA